jgi:frizzled 5/8
MREDRFSDCKHTNYFLSLASFITDCENISRKQTHKRSIRNCEMKLGTMNRNRIVAICLLVVAANVSAEKGYYGNGGSMNDGTDMEVHISMPSQKVGNPRCEEITIPMCRGIGYNMTKFPNEMNHETQEEAGLEVHQFWPLVEIKCSQDLKFFLCSMYTPICIEDYHKPLPVCRSVCERARKGCEPIMEKYSFKWPERMICENLPRLGDPDNLCMEHPSYSEEEHSSTNDNYNTNYNSNTNNNNNNNKKHHGGSSTTTSQKKCPKGDKKCQAGLADAKGKDCTCKCRYPLVPLGKESIWYNTTVGKVGSVNSCGIPCKGKRH